MPEYVTPGVCVEEIPTGPPPIAGVPTGVTGFVGETEHGPTTPTRIESWSGYESTFGGFIDRAPFTTPYWRLPYAVRGFFENGGRRCYVARVVGPPTPSGPAPANLAAIVGEADRPEDRTGIAALLTIAEIALMAVPDAVAEPAFATALLDRCEAAQDRFAILDAVGDDPLALGRHRASSWAALYYPQLRVAAPHLASGHVAVPACGSVAGVYARVDLARGVHKAPANEEVLGLYLSGTGEDDGPLGRVVTAREQDVLNPLGVNVIRDFRSAGRGVRIWGARTMADDPMWKYVNVRRLCVYIEQSIARGLGWVAFEPNAPPTWAAVQRAIGNFLDGLWRNGALQGTRADQAFFVRCDRSTMTQADIDAGRLVAVVGVAPVKPAEFVILRVRQRTADSK
jgi:uncharacterized protein